MLKATANDMPDPRMKDALQNAAQQMNAVPAEMLSKMTELLVMPPDLPLPPEALQKINEVRVALLTSINHAARRGHREVCKRPRSCSTMRSAV